jgi:hypothetical protein
MSCLNVVIVNGYPRSGKDTGIAMMQEILRNNGIKSLHLSSVDCVREMLNNAGISVRRKTEADRKLIAVVASAVEEHSQYRTNVCASQIRRFAHMCGTPTCVIFLQIRELNVMENLKKHLPDAEFTSLGFRSNRAEIITSNEADAGVKYITFDHLIANDGTLDELRETCRRFVKRFF